MPKEMTHETGTVRVRLNEKGWEIYRNANAFYKENVDDQGYSTFSYDYFERLFYPMSFSEFSTHVKF